MCSIAQMTNVNSLPVDVIHTFGEENDAKHVDEDAEVGVFESLRRHVAANGVFHRENEMG